MYSTCSLGLTVHRTRLWILLLSDSQSLSETPKDAKMPAIDSQILAKKMLVFVAVLGLSIFQCEGLPSWLKDRQSDDSTSNVGSPHLLQRPLREAGADLKQSRKHLDLLQEGKCPPGLWCKRTTEPENPIENAEEMQAPMARDGLQQVKNIQSEIESNARETDETQSDVDCPPGLWCKRDGYKVNFGNDRESTDLKTQTSCPWDLWCSNKRSFGLYDSKVISHCPPGLWCRRNTVYPNQPGRNCILSPNNPWCKERAYIDATMAKKRETARGCPPGLWCKR